MSLLSVTSGSTRLFTVDGTNGLSLVSVVVYMNPVLRSSSFHRDSLQRGSTMPMPEYERAKRQGSPPGTLTPAPMRVLKAIEKIEPCTSNELLDYFEYEIKLGTVQAHLNTLYWSGYVERRAGLDNFLIYRSLRSLWERNNQ